MKFSIITPSFRSGRWLRLCIASVADQAVEAEHIVQDSCSDDGTLDWLPKDRRVKAFVEKDQGMYDAINRGLRRAGGDILAYLNCDEQYLPGALPAVAAFFDQNPAVAVVFADAVVVNPRGEYICHRRSVLPTKYHTLVSGNLATLTCATYFRRQLVRDLELLFDTSYRIIGDAEWISRLLGSGLNMAVLPRFTSAFADTGENLCLKPEAGLEQGRLAARAPAGARGLRHAIIAKYRLRKWLAGHYSQKPFEYAVYTMQSPDARLTFKVSQPTAVWKRYEPQKVEGDPERNSE
jgi:glycosyltransferase involved in cell wall biosynthesis